jgi:tetratricopeptide (TPR) repeat protein/predicted Ser/Thr protein kinase
MTVHMSSRRVEEDIGPCLDEDQILAFARNEGAPGEMRRLEQHVDQCPTCFDVVANAVRVNFGYAPGLAETIVDGEPMRAPSPLAAGSRYLGRYELVEQVGSGGMGVVYRAYDPALRRYVALKLIRSDGHLANLAASLRVRLLREAHAMAKLTHPNVVTVFDVGFVDGQIFVAMEFIDGPTLHAWQSAAPRSWRETLACYIEAAKGLLAAHECGIVHRDFKPDNVLFSGSRVVVTDFGVAVSIKRDGVVTRDGSSYAGTPAYMAPEQFRGEPADARTDIFNFCAALYEALYGEPAFPGTDFGSRRKAVLAGRIRPPPPKTRVPNWTRRVLLKGLATDPAKRPQSIAMLIDALQPDAHLKRTRTAMSLVAMMAIVGGASAAVTAYRSPLAACRRQASVLAGLWSPEGQRQVQTAFARSGLPFQAQAWTTVKRALDDYVQRWTGGYTRACESAHRDGTQSMETLDLRLACLDERRGSFATLRDVLATGDPEAVTQAVSAVSRLDPVEVCDDIPALRATTPAPANLGARRTLREARLKLSSARSLHSTARYAEARRLANEALEIAKVVRHAPTIAESWYLLGRTSRSQGQWKQSEQEFLQVIDYAERGRADQVRARAAIALVEVVGNRQSRFQDGERWLHQAEVVLERVGNPTRDVAALALSRGLLALGEDNLDDAEISFRRALDLDQKVLAPSDPMIGTAMVNIGLVLRYKGRFDDARTLCRAAYEQTVRAVGAEHPRAAFALENLAYISYAQHKFRQALTEFQRALETQKRVLGPRHPEVAVTIGNLANVLDSVGDHQAAVSMEREALAILHETNSRAEDVAQYELNLGLFLGNLGQFDDALQTTAHGIELRRQVLGDDSRYVAEAKVYRAEVYMDAHRFADALALASEALPKIESGFGAQHPMAAQALDIIGEAERRQGHAADAIEHHGRALAIRSATADGGIASTLTDLGLAQLESHAIDDARATLEKALTERNRLESSPQARARTEFALARALSATNRDPLRIRTLAFAARSAYERGGPRYRPELDEVRRWLRRHGLAQ